MPLGRVWVVQVLPPLVVAAIASAWSPTPGAQQSDVLGQAMPPVRAKMPLGRVWVVQVLPPFVVATTPNEAAAQQCDVLVQATPVSWKVPLGRVWVVQVLPPLVVATMTPAVPVGLSPAAQQCDVLAQAMPRRGPVPLGRVWN